jgi:hypothetical protein
MGWKINEYFLVLNLSQSEQLHLLQLWFASCQLQESSVAQNSNSRCQPKNIFHRLSSFRTIFSIVSNHRIMSAMDAQLDILRPGTPNADIDIVDQPQVSYQLHLLFFTNLAIGADDNHIDMDDRLRSLIQFQSVQLLKLNPTKLIPRMKFL